MEKIMNTLNRIINSNAAINSLLACTFGVLAVRSMVQQQSIAQLEAEKDSLVKTNKTITKTIWDWKQALYSDAEFNPQTALVPLSTLKSIYGESVTPIVLSGGDDGKQGGNSAAPKFMV